MKEVTFFNESYTKCVTFSVERQMGKGSDLGRRSLLVYNIVKQIINYLASANIIQVDEYKWLGNFPYILYFFKLDVAHSSLIKYASLSACVAIVGLVCALLIQRHVGKRHQRETKSE